MSWAETHSNEHLSALLTFLKAIQLFLRRLFIADEMWIRHG